MAEYIHLTSASYLDNLVGKVAGAICTILSEQPGMQQKQFMLLPAITYKVKVCLARAQSGNQWTDQHLPNMAKDIRAAIVPLMWVFDFDPNLVYNLGPQIEQSALQALQTTA